MATPNPYKPSELPAEAAPLPAGTLTLGRALGFVLLTMTLFSVLGAVVGTLVGVVIPQYYAQLFGLAADETAIAAGAVLGLMQGGGAGIAIGVLLSGIVAWLQARLRMSEALKASRER